MSINKKTPKNLVVTEKKGNFAQNNKKLAIGLMIWKISFNQK